MEAGKLQSRMHTKHLHIETLPSTPFVDIYTILEPIKFTPIGGGFNDMRVTILRLWAMGITIKIGNTAICTQHFILGKQSMSFSLGWHPHQPFLSQGFFFIFTSKKTTSHLFKHHHRPSNRAALLCRSIWLKLK